MDALFSLVNGFQHDSHVGIAAGCGARRHQHDVGSIVDVVGRFLEFKGWNRIFIVVDIPVEREKVVQTFDDIAFGTNHSIDPLSDVLVSFEKERVGYVHATAVTDLMVNDDNFSVKSNVCPGK